MINSLVIDSGFINPVDITPVGIKTNWITVLIGRNGSKKSLLLRILAEAGLGRSRYRTGQGVINFTGEREDLLRRPEKVIAISGTPLDRFALAGSTDLKVRRRINREPNFVYLGQRAANGSAGVAQSQRNLVGSLITHRARLPALSEPLTEIFNHIGLLPVVYVKARLAESRSNYLVESLRQGNVAFRKAVQEYLHEIAYRERDGAGPGINAKELNALSDSIFANTASARLSQIRKYLVSHKSGDEILRIGLTRTGGRTATLRPKEWQFFIRLGLIEVSGVSFLSFDERISARNAARRRRVDGDHLSSGQWSWLASSVGLCTELQNKALVLVDEPENSLHPEWQLEYVPLISRLLRRWTECQVVIATHSPFIASGVSDEIGNVRLLRTVVGGRSVLTASADAGISYGWNATDVFERKFDIASTRAPALSKLATAALRLVQDNEPIAGKLADEIVEKLKIASGLLRPLDPMRDILASVSKSIRHLSTKRPVRKVETKSLVRR